jgi:hypothetical protein
MVSDNYKVKIEYGVAAVIALIGVFFIFQAFTIKVSGEAVGPRTMPMAIAVSLVIGAAWLAIRALNGKVGEVKAEYGFKDSDLYRITLVIGCGILFVVSFWLFGFFTAVIIGYVAALYAFGVRSKLKICISALPMAYLLHWLFMGVMMLNDPRGHLVDLRPLTDVLIGN